MASHARESRVLGERVKVLFVSANPTDTSRLKLGEELRVVSDRLRRSNYAARFDLALAPEVRGLEFGEALQSEQPDLVHFSGHGSEDGELLLSDDVGRASPAGVESIVGVFRSLSRVISVRCVVLNACFSDALAKGLSEHVDCVIGVPAALHEGVAITFAGAFYFSLGNRLDVQSAYDFAIAQLDLSHSARGARPVLRVREGVDARAVRILKPVVVPHPERGRQASPVRLVVGVASVVAAIVTLAAWRLVSTRAPSRELAADTRVTRDASAADHVVTIHAADAGVVGAVFDAAKETAAVETVAPPREHRRHAGHRTPSTRSSAVSAPSVAAPAPVPQLAPRVRCAFDDPSCQRVER